MTAATTAPGIRFYPGAAVAPAHTIHTTPLGYERATIAAGAPLPIPASAEIVDRLSECEGILVSFHGKLGDTLLALATARALRDWFRLRSGKARLAVQAEGPYAPLIARSGLLTDSPRTDLPGKFAVMGDRESVERHRHDAHVSVVCDPAVPPCWSTDGDAYPDMAARYYLALERRLGTRLPADAPFAPALATGQSELANRLQESGWFSGVTIAAITATSWPQLKDYTAERFTDVAVRIAEARRTKVRLLLIGGDGCARVSAADAGREVQVLHLDGLPADALADIFSRCDLVLGNDTGLTHLAAMARRADGGGPPVLGLYARHAHSKWRTGWPHHHAIATPFSERMHQGDLCPVRDAIAPDSGADLDAITPAALACVCGGLLDGALG
jgi:ADP-heptose:LPS heptosyltransferase